MPTMPMSGSTRALSAPSAKPRHRSPVRTAACRGPRIGAADTARFTRQLATMLNAGIPLLAAIALIGRGHPNRRFARLLSAVHADIEAGSSLAQALRRHPTAFDGLYCNLIRAGEEGGVLAPQLDRLTRQLEASIALRARLRAAVRYPAVVLAVAGIVMAILIGAVIPAFKDVFASMAGPAAGDHAPLPALTALVIAISDGIVAHWAVVTVLPMLAGAALLAMLRRSRRAQRLWDNACLRLPVVGPLTRKAVTARWTRTLSTLLAAGVPLVDAMETCARAAGNWCYRDATWRAAQRVRAGASLSQALRPSRLFDGMVLQSVRIGEEASALDTMLARVAESYERDVDEAVAALSGLVEPVAIVVLGVLIGGMVVAMYLPIFRLAQTV